MKHQEHHREDDGKPDMEHEYEQEHDYAAEHAAYERRLWREARPLPYKLPKYGPKPPPRIRRWR